MVFPVVRVVIWLIKPFVKSVSGIENIPKAPFIIAANHESYLDPFVLYYSTIKKTNEKIYFLGMQGRAKPLWKLKPFNLLFKSWAAMVPLDEGKKTAFKYMTKLLKQGKIVGIFPGGPRSFDGKLTKGKTGAVRLALIAKVPIVPIGINGSFEIAPREKLVPKFKKRIIVNIGKQINFFEYYNKKITRELLNLLTKRVMKEISKLSRKEYIYL